MNNPIKKKKQENKNRTTKATTKLSGLFCTSSKTPGVKKFPFKLLNAVWKNVSGKFINDGMTCNPTVSAAKMRKKARPMDGRLFKKYFIKFIVRATPCGCPCGGDPVPVGGHRGPPLHMKKFLIISFVILFTILFHYESTRHFFLEPFFKKSLPKTKFLFPPAGWIMFFHVGDDYGFAEVYGVKEGVTYFIDPHQILLTRDIGYDNVHRNVLSTVLSAEASRNFCQFLERKFPTFDNFLIVANEYPSVTKEPFKKLQQIMYKCKP